MSKQHDEEVWVITPSYLTLYLLDVFRDGKAAAESGVARECVPQADKLIESCWLAGWDHAIKTKFQGLNGKPAKPKEQ